MNRIIPLFMLAGLPLLAAFDCSGPCAEVIQKAALSDIVKESALRQVMSKAWGDSFPFGYCPNANPRVPSNSSDCQSQFNPTDFLSGLRVVCPKTPTIRDVSFERQVASQDSLSFVIDVGVGARVNVTGNVTRTFTGCYKEVTHDHNGTGTVGARKDPPFLLSQFAVGSLAVDLELTSEGTLRTSEGSGTITMGSKCTFSRQSEFRACSFLADGLACNVPSGTNQGLVHFRYVNGEPIRWDPRVPTEARPDR